MRLTRRASRLLAFGVVAAVILGAVITINFSKSASKSSSTTSDGATDAALDGASDAAKSSSLDSPAESAQKDSKGSPAEALDAELSSGFTLQNFNRSESKEGKKLWEISGEKGLISTSGDRARIDTTKLSFFRDDGSEVVLTAPKADLKIEGGLVSVANLSGGVYVEQVEHLADGRTQDYSASSDAATFDRIANLVTTNSTTIINSRMVTLTSGALKADLNKKKVVFFNGVKTVIRQDGERFTLPGQKKQVDKSSAKSTPAKVSSKKTTDKKAKTINSKAKKSSAKPEPKTNITALKKPNSIKEKNKR